MAQQLDSNAPPDPRAIAAAEACKQKLFATLRPGQPATAGQQEAFKECYTSNGLPEPQMNPPQSQPTADQTKIFQSCVAASGARLPTPDAGHSTMGPRDFEAIRDCSISAGMAPAAVSKSNDALDCLGKLFPDGLPSEAQMTPDQRAAYHACNAQSGMVVMQGMNQQQMQWVQSCMASERNAYAAQGAEGDERAMLRDCAARLANGQ